MDKEKTLNYLTIPETSHLACLLWGGEAILGGFQTCHSCWVANTQVLITTLKLGEIMRWCADKGFYNGILLIHKKRPSQTERPFKLLAQHTLKTVPTTRTPAVLKTLNHLTTRSGILVGLRRENDSCCYSLGCLRAWVIHILYTIPLAWATNHYLLWLPSSHLIMVLCPISLSVITARLPCFTDEDIPLLASSLSNPGIVSQVVSFQIESKSNTTELGVLYSISQ